MKECPKCSKLNFPTFPVEGQWSCVCECGCQYGEYTGTGGDIVLPILPNGNIFIKPLNQVNNV